MTTTNNTVTHDDWLKKPFRYPVCMLSECPRKDTCLRYQLLLVSQGDTAFGNAVMPNELHDDGTCSHFVPIRRVSRFYGLAHLFDNVTKKDYPTLRAMVVKYLGGRRDFYRYDSGEYTLSKQQVSDIAAIFSNVGYAEVPVADCMKTALEYVGA